MLRLLVIILFFLLSLLTVFPAPVFYLWYVAIIVTEFSWVFAAISLLLLVWGFWAKRFKVANTTFALAALVLYLLPIIQATQISKRVDGEMSDAFDIKQNKTGKPFSFLRIFMDNKPDSVQYNILEYDTVNNLTLDYYDVKTYVESRNRFKSFIWPRSCIIVIHGGSWKGGDSRQLPELNSVLVEEGYNVAAINYRKAPECQSPAPVEDTRTAIEFLKRNAGRLNIDTTNFILLGRSAGAQIALLAAYALRDMGIKGVISYYGPADMVWGYKNPANPLVFNSCKILEDYIGGTYDEAPNAYLASSPIEAVDSNTVPTLLIHGKNDVLVSYYHSPRLSQRLHKYNVPNYLLTLPWATHGCDYTLKGPSGQLATYAVKRFVSVLVK